jgi:hypothetical protein
MEMEMHPGSKNIKTIRFNKPVYIEELKFMNEDYNQYTLVASFKGKDQYKTIDKYKFGSEKNNIIVEDVEEVKIDQLYLSSKIKVFYFRIAWDQIESEDSNESVIEYKK